MKKRRKRTSKKDLIIIKVVGHIKRSLKKSFKGYINKPPTTRVTWTGFIDLKEMKGINDIQVPERVDEEK